MSSAKRKKSPKAAAAERETRSEAALSRFALFSRSPAALNRRPAGLVRWGEEARTHLFGNPSVVLVDSLIQREDPAGELPGGDGLQIFPVDLHAAVYLVDIA